MNKTSQEADSPEEIRGSEGETCRAARVTRALALLLASLSLSLAVAVVLQAPAAAGSVATARAAAAGETVEGRQAMQGFLISYGTLPATDDLRLEEISSDAGDTLVVLRDSVGGGTFSVRLDGLEVRTVTFSGDRVAARIGPSAGGDYETDEEPLWRATDWVSEREFSAAEASASVEVTPGVSVVIPSVGAAGSERLAAVEETASAVTVLEPNPVQYSVLPLPGVVESARDALLVPEEWHGVTSELAERTGYAAETSGTVPISYGGFPAVASYAAYRDGDRLRSHLLLVVFIPAEGRMVLVASQDEQVVLGSGARGVLPSQEPTPTLAEGEEGVPLFPSLPATGSAEATGSESATGTPGAAPAADRLQPLWDFLESCGLSLDRPGTPAGPTPQTWRERGL